MAWTPELDELARRTAMAQQMGGADKVKRQHDAGRLTVRERITRLVDGGSFHEVGALSGVGEYDASGAVQQVTPANCVFGRGRIAGRPVVVVGDDFTVRGGSADASISNKPLMAEDMAAEFRLPIVRIIEGSGGGGSVKTIETKGASNLPGGIGGTRGFWPCPTPSRRGRSPPPRALRCRDGLPRSARQARCRGNRCRRSGSGEHHRPSPPCAHSAAPAEAPADRIRSG